MQGFNMGRYVPPDQEGIISGNQLHGKHALGARANKISEGILTVRFEMPFPIWCTNCPKPTIIGQGVRFNAQKKQVGKYFSSPIFTFRMKHIVCGNWIEIRTDPKNTAYVVTEGARKRDLGVDKVLEGDTKILTQEEREALRDNAFASLEGKVEDKKLLEYGKKRLEELQDLSEQQWEDPYEKNKNLRNMFRVGRKQREKDSVVTAALQEKMSLGLDILPENEGDARRAGFIEFGQTDSVAAIHKAISKPLFEENQRVEKNKPMKSRPRKIKAEDIARKKKADLVAEIRGNTRASMDPFLNNAKANGAKAKLLLRGVKRKNDSVEAQSASTNALVDYESD